MNVKNTTTFRHRSTDASTLYRWIIGLLLAVLVTSVGTTVGVVISQNAKEHTEMKQNIKDMERSIKMMRIGYPRAPGVRP